MGQRKKVEIAKSLTLETPFYLWDEPLNYLDSFNYEQQQKARHQTDGETLGQILLPGLADGAGKPLRKTLVLTY